MDGFTDLPFFSAAIAIDVFGPVAWFSSTLFSVAAKDRIKLTQPLLRPQRMISFSEIKWNKVSTSVKLFFDLELTLIFFTASNFSVISIRWLLTVD